MYKPAPQFDPDAPGTLITLVSDENQTVPIPTLANGEKPDFIMFSCNTSGSDDPIRVSVGQSTISSVAGGHFYLSGQAGSAIVNARGLTHFAVFSFTVNFVLCTPMANG